MPFISTKVNRPIPPEKEAKLKAGLGEAIALIRGKSEQWLMLEFRDNCRLWFRGENDDPIAMVNVEIFGTASPSDCERLTAKICELLNAELGIAADHVYVNYAFSTCWGWNGANF